MNVWMLSFALFCLGIFQTLYAADVENQQNTVSPASEEQKFLPAIQAFIDKMAKIFVDDYFRQIANAGARDLEYMNSIFSQRRKGWLPDSDLQDYQRTKLKEIQKQWADGAFRPNDKQIKTQMVHSWLEAKLEGEQPKYENCCAPYVRDLLGRDLCIGSTAPFGIGFIIAGELNAIPLFIWFGTSLLIVGGSYFGGRLILLGKEGYESRKRKDWLIDHKIDLRREVLEVAHRTMDGTDLRCKISVTPI